MNPYDAQLCIYYTPETATTGQITKAERETQSSKLDFIERIGRIDDVETKLSPIKNSAFLADFTGWVNLAPAQVTIEDDNIFFLKRVRLYMNCPSLTQFLWADTNKYDKLCFWAFKPAVGGANIEAEIHYSDGTFSTEAKVLTNMWHEYVISLAANKIVSQIGFYDLGGICYLVLPQLVETPNVFQATRTNLKAQTEREDTLFKRFANTFAAVGDFELLPAVADQKHKVFSYGYNSDADIETLLRDGTSATNQVGISTTKGKMLQTLMHPFVGSVNTVLNLRAEGGVTVKGWIQYKTEA